MEEEILQLFSRHKGSWIWVTVRIHRFSESDALETSSDMQVHNRTKVKGQESAWSAGSMKVWSVIAVVRGKGVYFYLQALSAKGWTPKGRRGKENTLPVKQQVGFEPWAFWSTAECFNQCQLWLESLFSLRPENISQFLFGWEVE